MVVLFKCAITGLELSSDAYKVEEDTFFKIITGKMVEIKEGDYDIGANASEEGCEDDEGVEKFKAVFANCCGQEGQNHVDTYLTKKQLQKALKEYVMSLGKNIPDEATREEFKKLCGRKLNEEELAERAAMGDKSSKTAVGAAIYDRFTSKYAGATLDEEFMTVKCAEDYDGTGMIMGYRADGHQPGDKCTLILWKHGIVEEKY